MIIIEFDDGSRLTYDSIDQDTLFATARFLTDNGYPANEAVLDY